MSLLLKEIHPNKSPRLYKVGDFLFTHFSEILSKPHLWGSPVRDLSDGSPLHDILLCALADDEVNNMAGDAKKRWRKTLSEEQLQSAVAQAVWHACAHHDFSYKRKFLSSVWKYTGWMCSAEFNLSKKSTDTDFVEGGMIRQSIQEKYEDERQWQTKEVARECTMLASVEQDDLLKELFSTLTPKQKDIFYSKYILGNTSKSISKKYRIRLDKVNRILKCATRKILDYASQNDHFSEYFQLYPKLYSQT